MTIEFFNDEGEEVTIASKKVVCWRCKGEGSHVNPAIDGNGITAEEMWELGEDFLEDYISGQFDIPCQECNGLRVLEEPDPDRNPSELLAAYEAWVQQEADYRAEVEAELRFGC